MRHPVAPPAAATGNIDAALGLGSNDAAPPAASASQLQAGSRQILDSWAAQRGHHKRVFGVSLVVEGCNCTLRRLCWLQHSSPAATPGIHGQ